MNDDFLRDIVLPVLCLLVLLALAVLGAWAIGEVVFQ